MTLDEIISRLESVSPSGTRFLPPHGGLPEAERRRPISDLVYDSREVNEGALFFCLKGESFDGHEYAGLAVSSGAAALVCEKVMDLEVPQIVVDPEWGARAAMNHLAAAFYGDPSRKLKVVGVTGTNGKSTTSFMIHSILQAAGDQPGLIGTVETRVGDRRLALSRTTPESADLQRLFRDMVDAGSAHCVMEVSSHGLNEGRVDGTWFEIAVFTNLSQDHLDYHGSTEEYFAAKRSLFTPERAAFGLINADDKFGSRLLTEVGEAGSAQLPLRSYSVGESGDFRAGRVTLERHSATFTVTGEDLDLRVRINLPAAFNVQNGLAAVATAHLLGVKPDQIAQGLESLKAVPGRFEPVDEGQEFLVVVDYAHTPEGLRNVLWAGRDMVSDGGGRLIVVFGCGGDRDRGKRPLMGKAAAELADVVYLTSDNPRSEDPLTIVQAIERGLSGAPPSGGYVLEPDRRVAIDQAINDARPGDVVVIAGKGHETYQEIDGRKIDFDDRLVASGVLKRLQRGPD